MDTSDNDASVQEQCHLNFLSFWRESAGWSAEAGAFEERAGAILYATGSDGALLCNGVARIHPGEAAAQLLAYARAWFDARDRGYTLIVRASPPVKDDDLIAAAQGHGLSLRTTYHAMVRTAAPTEVGQSSGALSLRWVTDEVGIGDFVRVNSSAFATLDKPRGVLREILRSPAKLLSGPVETVVAYDQNEPIAAAQLLHAHGVAGVYWVGVVREHRRKGLGSCITHAVVQRAFERGARILTLQASPGGEPMYRRLGFETRYHYEMHVRPRHAPSLE
jgi:GNAT superfamily N-acetyltransferase